MIVTLAAIEAARRTLAGQVLATPMLPAPKLSALTGAEVYVKYENLQVTNSFKDRGAFVKLATLSETERRRGVIAMSAGNHAQAVAYHAARLGIRIELVKTSGDAVIPGVLANRYDIVASMGDFISRRDKLDFVDIVKGGNALVTKKGNPAGVGGIDDLCGRKLAVNKGSIQEKRAGDISDACAKVGKAAVQVMAYPDGPTAVLALQSGRSDVQWDDIASAFYKVSKNPNDFQVVGAPQDKDAPYGVGFPKEQSKLRDAVHAALQSLHKDGTYAKILDKWGVKEIAQPEIVINGSQY